MVQSQTQAEWNSMEGRAKGAGGRGRAAMHQAAAQMMTIGVEEEEEEEAGGGFLAALTARLFSPVLLY